ncbi:MAG: hypothetical protein ACI308_00950 [Muribaculaceae bacterium]
MNEMNQPTSKTKTQIHNVIILDRSGSMSSIRQAAVSGFNETLARIKKAQEQYSETQEHFVTLVTFCSCETSYVFNNTPVEQTHPLQMQDYEPCCCTPLYDAMGITLTSTHKQVKDKEDSIVVVTIITDGYENASKEYDGMAIKTLVEKLSNEGWTFTYMGANQDAIKVSMSLSIHHSRNFEYSDQGTQQSMEKDANTRSRIFERVHNLKSRGNFLNIKSRISSIADEAFNEEEEED